MKRIIKNQAFFLAILSACFLPAMVSAERSMDKVAEALISTNPSLIIKSMVSSPVPGILEVVLEGNRVVYGSNDGKYIFTGELIEIQDSSTLNLTQHRQEQVREDILSTIALSSAITFKAADQEQMELFIFTDVTCGYCRSFHTQIDEINKAGVTVHYLAFPRSGLDSRGARLLEQAWCAEDPRATLTELKAEGRSSATMLACNPPIAEQYRLATSMGITGTPYILTRAGQNLGGHLSTSQIVSLLD
ncbi:DsbC family protein [Alcanivorax quisquiliarum]|uniref:Thiol:disulfide interchange protein n=1 Tax=Alcanivorax quisquiliarum TaxID=2933565 RepID=A0ABT0E9P9_9GAMM|nr:DsbC family protein [Alcanivorax quisquiliarum]MCK0538573.1 DsbC family protein [Alcanivorax quisquiliarum]